MILLAGLAALVALCALRCMLLLAFKRRFSSTQQRRKTMIVLGSGGHTAEMLMLVQGLDRSFYSPRVYVVAETDAMSAKRALAREQEWAAAAAAGQGASKTHRQQQQQQQQQQQEGAPVAGAAAATRAAAGGSCGTTAAGDVRVEVIPRSREVGQSYLTSVFTTLYSLLWAARMVARQQPHLVLVNGPGTCIPVCAAAFANRVLLWADSRVVYVESIARVRKLSLSGAILYTSRVTDRFFVQWPELQARFPRSTYAGRLY